MTDSDTIKKCWYWPDTDTDTRIGAALENSWLASISKTAENLLNTCEHMEVSGDINIISLSVESVVHGHHLYKTI